MMPIIDNLNNVSIVFQQPLFAREQLQQNFPNTIGPASLSITELEAAFSAVREKLSQSTTPSALDSIDETTATEALNFYNYVVADGRHVVDIKDDPHAVATRLGYRVSPKALDLIKAFDPFRTGSQVRPHNTLALVVIGVAVIIVSRPPSAKSEIVIDQSGRVKI